MPVIFLRSFPVDKEKLARRIAAEKKIRSGPVCALSSLAPIPRWSAGASWGLTMIHEHKHCWTSS